MNLLPHLELITNMSTESISSNLLKSQMVSDLQHTTFASRHNKVARSFCLFTILATTFLYQVGQFMYFKRSCSVERFLSSFINSLHSSVLIVLPNAKATPTAAAKQQLPEFFI